MIVAIIIGIILGISAVLCFSSPSSEARFQWGSGFFESNRVCIYTVPVGAAPRPAPTFENNGPKRQSTETAQPQKLLGPAKLGKPQSRPTFLITAYCPCEKCCGQWSDGVTASGHIIQEGDRFVAAPSTIPFGTRLSVPGYAGGLYVAVLDRGGAIRGNRLDVFFDTHDEALAWGVRKFKVEK